MHTITTIKSTPTTVTRECSCGWWTIGYQPEPDHHIPLAQREADHFAEEAKIADGSIWNDIPAQRDYQLCLRHRSSTGERNRVCILAVWSGGFQEVLSWPWTADGLAAAQQWCDHNPTYWTERGHHLSTRLVTPGSLAVHVNEL